MVFDEFSVRDRIITSTPARDYHFHKGIVFLLLSHFYFVNVIHNFDSSDVGSPRHSSESSTIQSISSLQLMLGTPNLNRQHTSPIDT